MSLNGLEDPRITEAYETSLREAAGWFLLHYTARDEVALLGAGTGGVDEAREVIAQYKENSPLYGFFNHRNQKILLKYLPDGVSRLLQARVAVHSHDVIDQFTHDKLLTVQTPNEVTGAALSAACSLQGNTSQARSSTGSSEKTPKLQEIAEAVEECSHIDQAGVNTTDGRSEAEPVVSAPIQWVAAEERLLAHGTLMDRPRPLPRANSVSSRFSGDQRPGSRGSLRGAPHPTEHAMSEVSRRTTDVLPSLSEHGSDSALASRPSLSDVYNPAFYGMRPKVKLGPRPTTSKRPRTGGFSTVRNEQRPVASLPPGMRAAPRGPLLDRPSSSSSRELEASHLVPQIAEHPAPPAAAAPPVPEIAVTAYPRPTSRAESYTSFAPSTMTAYLRSQRVTPERRRLMKALQLRRNQMTHLPPISQRPVSVDQKEVNSVMANSSISTLTAERQDASQEATIFDPKDDSGVQMNVNVNFTEDNPPVVASPESLTSALEDSEVASTAPSSVSDIRECEDPASSGAESPSIRTPVQSALKTNENIRASLPQLPDVSSAADSAFSMQGDVAAATQQSGLNLCGHNDNLRRRNLAPGQNHSRKLSAERVKRHGLIEPVHIDFSLDNTSGYISDDSFIEELQSAQVKEAKPVYATSVTKSPSKSPTNLLFTKPPGVERRPSSHSVMSVIIRRSSTRSPRHEEHSDKGNARPGSTPAEMLRPLSIASQRAASDSPRPLTPANRNVSNGISQRIKALADLSAGEPGLSQPLLQAPVATDSSPSSLLAPRKSSFRTPTKRPASFAQSLNLNPSGHIGMTSAPSSSLYLSPHNSSPPNHSDFRTVYNLHENNGKTESISVTARIIRHAPIQNSDSASKFQLSPPQFHQSPLIIDHGEIELSGSADRETPVLEQTKPPVTPQTGSLNKPSLTSPAEAGLDRAGLDRSGRTGRELPQSVSWESSLPTLSRPSFDGSWRNFRRRSRDTRSPPPAPRALSMSSLGESVGDEKTEEKRESRTSRLLKRVSLLSSGSRRSLASYPVKEETVETQPSVAEMQPLPPAVAIGDLNVQFPDTLLWKRKWVAIDGHGYLIFGPSRTNENPKGIVKRYHLAEFRTPYAPDQERQEMPHSIILDLVSGSSLQCACEDPAGQLHTLNTLQDYQRAWKYHEP